MHRESINMHRKNILHVSSVYRERDIDKKVHGLCLPVTSISECEAGCIGRIFFNTLQKHEEVSL